MNIQPKISIITSARNEEKHVKETLISMVSNTSYNNYEIIAVNDASNDNTEKILGSLNLNNLKTLKTNGLGTAKARNFGAHFAKGDLLIFCDFHITVPYGWLEKIAEAYNNIEFDCLAVGIKADKRSSADNIYNPIIAYGQTLNENVQPKWIIDVKYFQEVPVAAGGFVIYKKDVFKSIGEYDKGFNTWSYEDVELSIKTWLMGYSIKAFSDFYINHYFRKKTTYDIDMVDYYFNHLRTAILHFNEDRIEKVKKYLLEKLKIYEDSKQLKYSAEKSMEIMLQNAINSNIMKERETYFKMRKYSDDWYFDKFNINF